MNTRPRVIGMLVGDLNHQMDMQTKYGAFFDAFAQRFELVDIYDASLKGFDRLINAMQMFHFQKKKWKERFFKNVPAFKRRSTRADRYLRQQQGKYDYVLQLGVLFDANTQGNLGKTLIYSDYTAALSARHPEGGRTPFTPKQLTQWLHLEKQAYQQAEHVFVRAGLVKQSLIEDYNIPAEKVTRIGAGVNFPHLPPRNIPRQYHEPTVLFIGHDFYRKGGDLLLKAFIEVKAQLPQARLLILTKGPIPDKLPANGVEFISPTWDRSSIEALYRRAHVLVLPSRLETWGDVLLEAMAYEIPCIGVTGQAMEDIIVQNSTGILVQPESPAALSQGMLELLSQPGLLTSYGSAARERIDAHFTWAHVVDQMANRICAQ
jgi:glycosyltransferase involved in cell wall biosynthesis